MGENDLCGWEVVWRGRCSPKCLFSCLCGSLVPAKLRSNLLWLKEEKEGVGAAVGLLLITLFGFLSTHPTAALLPEGAGWDMVGAAMEERSSWVKERLAMDVLHPAFSNFLHLMTSPSPPELGLAYLCNTAAAFGPSLENASSSTHLEHYFPPYLSPSPQSDPHTRCLCGWCTYVWFLGVFCLVFCLWFVFF